MMHPLYIQRVIKTYISNIGKLDVDKSGLPHVALHLLVNIVKRRRKKDFFITG